MKQQTTPAIILRRTNYAEADRIVTFITPAGKVRALVKGVRRSKSKLAGGIELFSESTITFIETRGELARIISTRLNEHWDGIVGNLQRMMFGYEAMKLIDAVIEDDAERAYYDTLKVTLRFLADEAISLPVVELWFYSRILELSGRALNLRTDNKGAKLTDNTLYNFSVEDMSFTPHTSGAFHPDHIKLLRFATTQPVSVIVKVKESGILAEQLLTLVRPLTQ